MDVTDATEMYLEDAGQHEPITTRLSNILQEYKDGLTIIKELIQNADDAKATEVNILYDARCHPSDDLMFPGMAKAHGPALVVHNDAKFTDKDFVNITKLAGATKKDQPMKIGKFGVGFCSVYHITDVPSFVSGEWLYIFDPAFAHLEKEIKDRNQPGKKMVYTKLFKPESQQMSPYDKLFGFDKTKPYNCTMFRFPFRPKPSPISEKCYNKSRIDSIREDFIQNGAKMLLFLDNVRKLTFQTVRFKECIPTTEVMITKVSNPFNVSYYSRLRIARVTTDAFIHENASSETWLVASKDDIIRDCNQLGRVSVASKLIELEASKFKCEPIEGAAFCFLPLGMQTGLPVHISANFAVMSNRTGIWANNYCKNPTDVRESWNKKLMETIIPTVYLELLLALKEMTLQQVLLEYDFSCLLPLAENLCFKQPWEHMIIKLYTKMLDKDVFYAESTNEWLSPRSSMYMPQQGLLAPYQTGNTPDCVLKAVSILHYPVVNISSEYILCIKKALSHSHWKKKGSRKLKEINEEHFIEVFFASIILFQHFFELRKLRNEVIFLIFRASYSVCSKNNPIRKILESQRCIPCKPDGRDIKFASQIVDPKCAIHELLDTNSELLPIESFSDDHAVYSEMSHMGLIRSYLPLNEIVKCAKALQSLFDQDPVHETGLKRTSLLLQCISSMPENPDDDYSQLKHISFIPVLPRPANYPFIWKAEYTDCKVSSFSEIFLADTENYHFLLGSQKIFMNTMLLENAIPKDKRWCSKVCISCKPIVGDVLAHFQILLDHNSKKKLPKDFILNSTKSIYNYLNQELKNEDVFLQCKKIFSITFREKSSIYIPACERFVNPQCVAKHWRIDGPFLYKLPDSMVEQRCLLRLIEVPDVFSTEKLLQTLTEIYQSETQPENYLEIVEEIIGELNRKDICDFDVISNSTLCTILPDSGNVLRPTEKLFLNDDVLWLPLHDDEAVVNPHIKKDLALRLGVKKLERSHFVDKYGAEIEDFGQSEVLTQRIKSILHDYPLDVTFLHELLQNADDAEASKMYVILDKRTHGKERLPSVGWEKLQGPALLVWNNGKFTKEDMEGIQNLGLGSKLDDTESIGQFGIGFNVVYHITDCPSFAIKGETLCVLDPYCGYIEGACPSSPGRRYKNLNDNFWNPMSDLADAYLQKHIPDKAPQKLANDGVLFRLPIRQTISTDHYGKNSRTKLIEFGEVISCGQLEKLLDMWVPAIKDSLLFLQHTCEFRYYIIDMETNSFKQKAKYCKKPIDSTSKEKAQKYFNNAEGFKQDQKPFTITHELSVKSEEHFKPKDKSLLKEESWIVHQGIGDVQKPDQKWGFIKNVLPKHGIAAPLVYESKYFEAKLFCFLPLPITTGLPVHINGQFILGTNRRSLWSGETEDKRSKWNSQLFNAISSSYAAFLEIMQSIIMEKNYSDKEMLQSDLESYYSFYPFYEGIGLSKEISMLAKSVFDNLWRINAKILCQEKERSGSHFEVLWHHLHSDNENEDSLFQVFFKPPPELGDMIPMLKKLKMILTDAPLLLYTHLAEHKPMIVNLTTVFKFFCDNYSNIMGTKFPCPIEKTPFESSACLKEFVFCLLGEKRFHYEFPSSPFGYPLLLTADNNIRLFEEKEKVLQSHSCCLFENKNSLRHFLHPEMFSSDQIPINPSYFLSADEMEFSFINRLFEDNFPLKLEHEEVVDNSNNCILSTQVLEKIWECLSSEEFLNKYIADILNTWALIPATNGMLYAHRSCVLPLIPVNEKNVDFNFFNCLTQYSLPILDREFLNCPLMEKFCLSVSMNNEQILSALFYLQYTNQIFETIGFPTKDLDLILEYLGRINFRKKGSSKLVKELKTLPIFETVEGTFTALAGKKVYLWPEDFCMSGFDRWAPCDSIVFLKLTGSWNKLCDFSLLGEEIDEKEIFMSLILPSFKDLSDSERYEQLLYIRENIFYHALFDAKRKRRNNVADRFVQHMREVKCLKHSKVLELFTASSFYDHSLPIFNVLPSLFEFLPQEYRSGINDEDKEWLDFFYILGLRREVSFEEYVALCQNISHSEMNLKDATDILLNYLFSDGGRKWFQNEHAVNTISKIEFVPVLNLNIEIPGLKLCDARQIVELSSAAIEECAPLVWSTRPIVRLPKPLDIDNQEYMIFLRKLRVIVDPNPSDVYQNIYNISRSGLSKFSLFFKYSVEHNDPQGFLLNSVVKSLLFLHRKDEKDFIEKLSDINCVPVSGDSNSVKLVKPVLVKPTQVVRKMALHECEQFFPYIIAKPKFLRDIDFLLYVIGVEERLELKHMQIVLARIYELTQCKSQLDPNQICTVRNAVLKLGRLLKFSHYMHESEPDYYSDLVSSTLYLPTVSGKKWHLMKSSDLFYADMLRYASINLTDQPHCSIFKIPPDCFDGKIATVSHKVPIASVNHAFRDVSITELDVCLGIPKERRPRELSLSCHEELVSKELQQVKGPSNPLFLHMNRLMKHKYLRLLWPILSSSIQASKQDIRDSTIESFVSEVRRILGNLSIIVLDDLVVKIIFTKENKQIGILSPNFYMRENVSSIQYKLYISKKVTARPAAIAELAETVVLEVLKTKKIMDIDETIVFIFQSCLQECLKVRLLQEIKSLSDNFNIKTEKVNDAYKEEDLSFEEGAVITPQLGICIPEIICDCYLDRSENNMYYPQEWVGFEIEEEIFIWAVILYKSPSVGQKVSKYVILVDRKEREIFTEEVSVTRLCKFVMDDEIDDDSSTENEALEDSVLMNMKLKIRDEIESITDDMKENAIRRLYMKYNPATVKQSKKLLFEQLFKFLLSQIARFERGEPLNLEIFEDHTCSWSSLFPQWDMHISRINEHRKRGRGKRNREIHKIPNTTTVKNDNDGSCTNKVETRRHVFQPTPSIEEAQRWLKQANSDLLVISETSSPCHKLFLAHEVIEKSLKAGVYKLVGLNPSFLKHHELKSHAYAICTLKPEVNRISLAEIATKVEEKEYYVKSRFPNQLPDGMSPTEFFSREEADGVVEDAKKVIKFIEENVVN